MFDKFRSRRGKLELGVVDELSKKTPDTESILKLVDKYEKDNLDTIDKLKRDKRLELNRINGALKQSIDAHGPITKVLIGSAGKRIYGALMASEQKEEAKPKIALRYIILALVIGLCIGLIL